MAWKHWDERKFITLLLKTGQTTSYQTGDDGDLELGVAHDFAVLTTGRYSGTINITINGKTHATNNACVKDNNTGKMWHREVIQADIGPTANGTLFWGQYTLGPKIDITFTAATKIIHSVAGDFSTGACCVGRKITVSGAAQAGNNQDVTVAAITANDMTVNEVLVNEGAGASVSFASVDDLIWDLKDQANANSLAGYTDWRIPNRRELESIVDLGQNNPSIDEITFPSTPATYQWTSSTNLNPSSDAWVVIFTKGVVYNNKKITLKMHVRLVRN
ncbi:DUF1566 domain-containing protein [candidate division WOR-3 bacterium]|nr:DUF1566 domain-containing protein [candidate division WOR-3 bacterium]